MKASTADENGLQKSELNFSVLLFKELANLSTEWGPHNSSINAKKSSEKPQSS
jgi:hypothetical protein